MCWPQSSPLTRRWAARLFKHGLAHIAERVPLSTAVRDGIDPEPWVALVTHLTEYLAAKLDVPIIVTLPFAGNAKVGRDEWLDLARTTLDAGDALLLLLAGEHRHYTMAARLTPAPARPARQLQACNTAAVGHRPG